MDASDLRARIEAATIRWRKEKADGGTSAAKAAHIRLLALLDSTARRAKPRNQLREADTRKLVVELREVSLQHLKLAASALSALRETGCYFEYEQQNMAGERHELTLDIRDIPYLEDAQALLPLTISLAELPQVQQTAIVRHLEQDADVRHLEVRQQIERAEGTAVEKVQRALKVASAQASLGRSKAALLPLAREWLSQHQGTLSMLGWSNLTFPILGTGRLAAEQILQASTALDHLSDCLVMPFPLSASAETTARRRWAKLWRICEDAAESFSMVSAWLRCLGSTGEYKRCQLCFRHVGEGLKKNCSLHHRTARVRLPAREQHVSEIYKKGWRLAAKDRPGVSDLLNDPSPSDDVEQRMLRAAQEEGLAPVVTTAAASLAAVLRTLLPLLGSELRDLVKQHFDACVAEANQRICRADLLAVPPGRAIRGLSWERFFGALFASKMSSNVASGFSTGKPIDLDHPLASTMRTITVQKLALDLLHLDVWISVDMAFDSYSYLDADAVHLDIAASLEQGHSRPTYRQLAKLHRATAQAVHGALLRSTSGSRSNRVLRQGKKELQRFLLGRSPR